MPSSSLILSVGTILSALSSTVVATKYQQQESFNGKNWLDAFKFETYDYNNGFVNYVDQSTAISRGLYKTSGDDVLFGVDSIETLNYKSGPGRKSVRLEGKKNYNKGLFIIDVKRMPGVCGMWPAFWSLGQEPWPVKGEIDIIEGVNDNTVNKYVLHTDTKCKVDGLGQSNPAISKDCALDSVGPAGCDVNEVRTNSFGANFNKGQGGYYVMEWDSDAIRTWFFPRGSTIPRSLTTESPDTSEFGTPAANFKGDCNIDQRFKDQRFIFTNNFCGDWAGNAYLNSNCPKQFDAVTKEPLNAMDSCKQYVASNPRAFASQFWQIGSFRTFSKKQAVSSSSMSMSRSSSRASSSTRASSTPARASSTPARSSPVRASSTPARSSPIQRASSTPASPSLRAVNNPVMPSSHASSSSVPHSASSAASSPWPVLSPVNHHVTLPSSDGAQLASPASSETPYPSSISHVVSSSMDYRSSSSSPASVPYDAYSSAPMSYPAPAYNDYPSGSSSVIYYNGDASAPVSYPTPAYSGSGSAPVYPDELATSTPCTTPSAVAYSVPTYPVYPSSDSGYGKNPSYPMGGPVKHQYANSAPSYDSKPAYPNSAPGYDSYPKSASAYGSYPASSPVKNDYPYLPSFTPVTSIYPPTTSAPSYNTYPVSKTTITTTYTTTYVDVCSTGYTTKTTTFAVTYCPSATPVPGPPTYGWDVTTKVCDKGCGKSKKTVTLTVPCTNCNYATPMPKKPGCDGHDCEDSTTVTSKVYSTKYITLSKIPVPARPKSDVPKPPSYSAPVYGGDKPASKPVHDAPKSVAAEGYAPVLSSKLATPTPVMWVGGNEGNGTMGYTATGTYGAPLKTGYAPPVFTGAASGLQVASLLAIVGAVATMVF